jgi:hypothetical protein
MNAGDFGVERARVPVIAESAENFRAPVSPRSASKNRGTSMRAESLGCHRPRRPSYWSAVLMATKNIAVFGIYRSASQAESAVNVLLQAGFSSEDVSVLLADQQSTREFAHEKNTKAPEGATAGAATGGVLGGALGVLVGLGTLAIPGIGPFVAAGPLVAALAGVGAGGALGGLIGALVGMGIPEYEAKRYEGRVKEGGVLLSAHCETAGEVLRAKEVLKDTGATDIAASGESAVPDSATSRAPRHPAAMKAAPTPESAKRPG